MRVQRPRAQQQRGGDTVALQQTTAFYCGSVTVLVLFFRHRAVAVAMHQYKVPWLVYRCLFVFFPLNNLGNWSAWLVYMCKVPIYSSKQTNSRWFRCQTNSWWLRCQIPGDGIDEILAELSRFFIYNSQSSQCSYKIIRIASKQAKKAMTQNPCFRGTWVLRIGSTLSGFHRLKMRYVVFLTYRSVIFTISCHQQLLLSL